MNKFTLFTQNPQYTIGGENKPSFSKEGKVAYLKTLVDLTVTIKKNIFYLTFDKANITLTLNDLKLLNFTMVQVLNCNHVYINKETDLYYWITDYTLNSDNSILLTLELDYWLTFWPLDFLKNGRVFVERCHADSIIKKGDGYAYNNNFISESTSEIDGKIKNVPFYVKETQQYPSLMPSDAIDLKFSYYVAADNPLTLYRNYQLTVDTLDLTSKWTQLSYSTLLSYSCIPQISVMYRVCDDLICNYPSQTREITLDTSRVNSNEGNSWYANPYLTQTSYLLVDETQIKLYPCTVAESKPPSPNTFSKDILPLVTITDNKDVYNNDSFNYLGTNLGWVNKYWFTQAFKIPQGSITTTVPNYGYMLDNLALPLEYTTKNLWLKSENKRTNPFSAASKFCSTDMYNTYNAINGINFTIGMPNIVVWLLNDYQPTIGDKNYSYKELKLILEYGKLQVTLGNNQLIYLPLKYLNDFTEIKGKIKQFVTPTENFLVLDFSDSVSAKNIMKSTDKRFMPAFKNALNTTTASSPIKQFWNQHESTTLTSLKQAELSIEQNKLGFVKNVFGGSGAALGGAFGGGVKGGFGGVLGGLALGGIGGAFGVANAAMNVKQAELAKQQIYSNLDDLARQPDHINTTISNNSFYSTTFVLDNLYEVINFQTSLIDLNDIIKAQLWLPSLKDQELIINNLSKNGYSLNKYSNIIDDNGDLVNSRYYYNYWKISLIEQAINKANYNNFVIDYFNQEFNKGVRLWNVANDKVSLSDYSFYNVENDLLSNDPNKIATALSNALVNTKKPLNIIGNTTTDINGDEVNKHIDVLFATPLFGLFAKSPLFKTVYDKYKLNYNDFTFKPNEKFKQAYFLLTNLVLYYKNAIVKSGNPKDNFDSVTWTTLT